MRGLLLFTLAWGLGFAAAIPVGPSQVEMAKRAIGGRKAAAAMVIVGSVNSDIVYGGVALFGIAPILETPWVLAAFNAAGVVILWILGIVTLRESRRPHDLRGEAGAFGSLRWAWVTGFTLAASNPPMILSWLLGVAVAKHLGLATPFPFSARALFLAGGALGLGSYLAVLGVVLYRVKHFIPAHALNRVYFWLGVTLFALSVLFAAEAVRYLLAGR